MCLVSGMILLVAYSYFFDSPEEKMLREEIAINKQQMEYMALEIDKSYEILSDLRDRDINTYRVIFEAEPLSSALWVSGTGGSQKYKNLKKYSTGELMVDLNNKIDLLKRQLNWQSKSYDEIAALIMRKEDILESLPAIQPIANVDLKRMASGFGMRIDPVYGVPRMHAGMDFTAEIGTEIYATGKGVASKVSYSTGGYGNRIIINHGNGYQTLYAHMNEFAIKEGETVTRGQVIGYVGNTGKSVGPHLHYEVHKNGEKVNPVYFYYQDLDDEAFAEMIRLSENAGSSLD